MTWYTGDTHFDTVLAIGFAIAAFTAVAGQFVATPYGRFADESYGVGLDPRLGWLLMELPAPTVFLFFFLSYDGAYSPFAVFMLWVWLIHYANRGFIMPALMRVPVGQNSSFSLSVVVMGWIVTSLHGYLNAQWATTYSGFTDASWFSDPRFLLGVGIYYGALAANIHSDSVVRNLRTKAEVAAGEKHYRIPQGGLFRYVSNPSYFTELVLWVGFSLFTWSLAGVYILAISMANLIPRAVSTHAWYCEKFPDYPKERKILIPFIW